MGRPASAHRWPHEARDIRAVYAENGSLYDASSLKIFMTIGASSTFAYSWPMLSAILLVTPMSVKSCAVSCSTRRINVMSDFISASAEAKYRRHYAGVIAAIAGVKIAIQ